MFIIYIFINAPLTEAPLTYAEICSGDIYLGANVLTWGVSAVFGEHAQVSPEEYVLHEVVGSDGCVPPALVHLALLQHGFALHGGKVPAGRKAKPLCNLN